MQMANEKRHQCPLQVLRYVFLPYGIDHINICQILNEQSLRLATAVGSFSHDHAGLFLVWEVVNKSFTD